VCVRARASVRVVSMYVRACVGMSVRVFVPTDTPLLFRIIPVLEKCLRSPVVFINTTPPHAEDTVKEVVSALRVNWEACFHLMARGERPGTCIAVVPDAVSLGNGESIEVSITPFPVKSKRNKSTSHTGRALPPPPAPSPLRVKGTTNGGMQSPSTPQQDLETRARLALEARPCPLFDILVANGKNVQCRICQKMVKTSSKDFNHENHLKTHDIDWKKVMSLGDKHAAEVVEAALRRASRQAKLTFTKQ